MKNNNKIAIVSTSLGIGGAERFASLLSFMLHDLGYEVHNIIVLDVVKYEYKGKLLNLGKKVVLKKTFLRGVKKGICIDQYLKENKIEVIIDNRSRPTLLREIFTKWIYGNRKVYYMIHSAMLEMYMDKSLFWTNYLYTKNVKLICVSKGIEDKIQQTYYLKNTITLYNPIIFPHFRYEKPAKVSEKYILFFGRLEEEIKNFSLLLNAYLYSKIYELGMNLIIIGDGKDNDFIFSKIAELQLENFVKVLPFQNEVSPYIQNARYTVLTSKFEGFPMSIIESLAEGIPVVSVNCETGPSEIIVNKYNGLLVENHDEKILAKALKIMVTDENLYQNCKNNAQKSVEHLSLTTITQKWGNLLKSS